MARLDAVVALQDQPGDGVRARVEAREPGGALERVEALGLGVASWRNGGAESADKHRGDRGWDASQYRQSATRALRQGRLQRPPRRGIEKVVGQIPIRPGPRTRRRGRRVNPAIGRRPGDCMLRAPCCNPRSPIPRRLHEVQVRCPRRGVRRHDPARRRARPCRRRRGCPRPGRRPPRFGETDPDHGPSFNWRGRIFPNQKAFVDSGARCSTRHVTDFEQYLHDLGHETWKLERASQGRSVAERAPGTVQVPVVVHVIRKGTGIANGDVTDVADHEPDRRAQRRLRRHRLVASPSRCSVDRTTNTTWYTWRRARRRDADAKNALRRGTGRRPQHLHREPGRRPARLGDLPARLRRAPEERRRRHPLLVAARRQRRALQPGRHRAPTRSATGWACTTRSRAAAREAATASPTRRPSARPPSAARPAATPAATSAAASTRSRTSWTTPTTPAWTRSSAGQDARMDALHQQYRGAL